MEKHATTASAKPALTPLPFGVIQRKCDCGGSACISGECEECQEKQLTINRYSTGRRAPSGLLPSRAELAQSTMLSDSGAVARYGAGYHFGRLRVGPAPLGGTSGERAVSQPGDRSEEEADRAAEQVMRALSSPVFEEKQEAPTLSQSPPLIQREVADESASEMEDAPETATAPETASPEETPAPALIVEDDASEVGPGQMRKSEFLDELRAAVCAAADAELAAVGRDTEGCPYIERWIEYYRARDCQHIERAIRRYTPEAAGVASARDYISLISERVRSAVAVWARTGEITGVPEGGTEEITGVPEGTPAASPEASSNAAANTASASGDIQFKSRGGGAVEAGNPAAIQAKLGAGQALDGGVKSRMESAFGYNFSRVRLHTDAKAAGISSGLNARAFTIGSDVAFAQGEYRPGTLIGDALIAHELAHVVQQGGASSSAGLMQRSGTEYNTLEEDADLSAVGAVVGLWGRAKASLANITQNAAPRLRSGLSLQRCRCDRATEVTPTTPLALVFPSIPCEPKPKTLDEVKAIPGVPESVLGVTNTFFADTFSMDFEGFSDQTCKAKLKKEPEITFTDFAYTKSGTYSNGTETPTKGPCKGKTVNKMLTITDKMADKIKQGEIEHCEDDKRAFALGSGKFTQAIKELATGYCAEGAKSCADEAKTRLTARTGVKFDDWLGVSSCLAGKSKLRDSKSLAWHWLTNFGTPDFARDCSTVTYKPDHTVNLLEIGKHSSEDLVKGCGEK